MTSSIYMAKKAEFARAAGVANATATKLFKPGHLLHDALVGNLVDMSHPKVLEYLTQRATLPKGASVRTKKRGGHIKGKSGQYVGAEQPPAATAPDPPPVTQPAVEQGAPAADQAPPPTNNIQPEAGPISYDLKDYEHLTVREVVMRYGNIDAFKRFVESAKQVADYKLKEISIQKTRGELVDREAVRKQVFQIIDVAFSRLVSDVPASVSKQLMAIAQTGGDGALLEIEEMIRDANSQALQNCKHTVKNAKVLSNANNRHAGGRA